MSLKRKARIRDAFGKAQDYDAQALVQTQAAERLADLAIEHGLKSGLRVLDMGCGTGILARAVARRVSPAALLCADVSPDMLARARLNLAALRPPALLAAMDAQHPALHPAFDAVLSSMALHWTVDLGRTLAQLWHLVRPGGLLAVCLPGQGTFEAWRAAHEACGLACGLHAFPALSQLAAMLPAQAELFQDERPMRFQSAKDFPRHLKAIGAAVPRTGFTPLPPAHFRAVLAALDQTFPDGPVIAYRLLYAVAVKPKE